MQEDFLHFIYKNRLWEEGSEMLTDGTPFEIIDTGLHNSDSGPDFFNAKIRIGETIWAGNVEIHINSSDWYKHNHNRDLAYNNVILHIVYNYDKPVLLPGLDKIPTWEIKFPHLLYNKYAEFKIDESPVHCHNYIDLVNDFKAKFWFARMAAERLQNKSDYVSSLLEKFPGDFEQVFYVSLARSFGFGINSEPFEQLALSLPLSILRKYNHSIFKTEALLFGQSGLLETETTDNYVIELKNEYSFLQKKHSLKPLSPVVWKKSKLRPSNFPQVRIAQFSSLMTGFQGLFSAIFENADLSKTENYFKLKVSDYWKTHYTFGKPVDKANTGFGSQSFEIIAINTIAPVAFYYFNNYNSNGSGEKVTDWLCSMKPEDNREIRFWKQLKITADNAYESQALLNLKKNYCDRRKCLDCTIGNEILKELNKI